MTSWYRDDKNGEKKGGGDRGEMKESARNPASRRPNHRFDFDIGYLVKSPCRDCDQRDLFPGCDESCRTLDKIHSMLCDSISCSKNS